jgi:hypothetical protein
MAERQRVATSFCARRPNNKTIVLIQSEKCFRDHHATGPEHQVRTSPRSGYRNPGTANIADPVELALQGVLQSQIEADDDQGTAEAGQDICDPMFEIVIPAHPCPNKENALEHDLKRDEHKHQQELIAHEPEVREVHPVIEDPPAYPMCLVRQQQDRKQVTGNIGRHACVPQFQMKVTSGFHTPPASASGAKKLFVGLRGNRSCGCAFASHDRSVIKKSKDPTNC